MSEPYIVHAIFQPDDYDEMMELNPLFTIEDDLYGHWIARYEIQRDTDALFFKMKHHDRITEFARDSRAHSLVHAIRQIRGEAPQDFEVRVFYEPDGWTVETY